MRSESATAVERRRDARAGVGAARIFAAALSLALAASAGAANHRDLAVDQAMGVLDADPVLDRLLTQPPEPWPGPRGEQPFDQQPPGVQEAPPTGTLPGAGPP